MNENDSFQLFNEKNDENNIEEEKFDDTIIEKINQYKELNYEPLYNIKSFCDIKINDKWIVGKILNISEDMMATVTDFENSSGYIKVVLFDSEKISYYRKYTKPNEKRLYKQRDTNEQLEIIQKFIQLLLKYNFGDYEKKDYIERFNSISAYDMIQNLRGKIYYWFDSVLNINDNNSGIDICINIIELLLNLIKNFYDYLKKNNDIIIKYKKLIGTKFEDIILFDKRYSIITFEKDAFEIYNKIMGRYPNYNDFYIRYSKEVKKFTNNRYNKKIKKICNKKIYDGDITEYRINENQVIPIYPICYFIDYFNYLNGFQSISNYIVSNISFSFDVIESYIYLFKRIYIMLDEKNNQLNNKLTSQLNQLRVYFQKRMNKLTENEIKYYPNEKMINLILQLSNILPFDDNIKINTFEELYLNYISACFLSQNLEKKIYAMNTFNSIITSIDNNQNNKIMDKTLYCEPDKYIKNMIYEILINSLVKIRILHFILEENVHVEIIKRSLPIILLLYKTNFNLQDLEIEKIFENRKKIIDCLFLKLDEADKKSDEILIKTLKDIISKLSIFLLENDREYTFNLIKDYIKNRIIIIDNINLIKDFTINYLKQEKKGFDNNENKKDISFNEKKYLGIQFLWNYMLDKYYIDNSLNNNNFNYIEIINQCINSLIEIVNLEILNHDNFKRKVLFNIINCINNNQSEVQCLKLLKKLILQSNIFNQLLKTIHDKKNDTFLDLIINNFNKYYIKVLLNEENKRKSFEEISNSIFQGLYSHIINLKIRIELLIVLLNKEIDIEMHLDNFTILWNYSIKNDFSKELLYKQLLDNINNFLYTFKKNIFEKILLDNNLFKIDNMLSFTLFTKFMLTINIANGVFILINNKDLRVDEKSYKAIIGLNKLWNILLYTNNNEIQNQVSSILSNICLNVKNPNSKNSTTFWSNFIQELIQLLNLLKMNEIKVDNEKRNNNFEIFSNINQISNMKNNHMFLEDNSDDQQYEIGIKGLIILIKKIYEKFGSKGKIIDDISGLQISNDLNDPNEEFLKYIFSYNKKEYLLKISFNEPLYIIRYKVSNYFEIPVNTIQFQYDTGKNEIKKFDLCNDFELFNTLLMRGQMIDLKKTQNVNICLINNPIVNVEKNPKQLLNSLNDVLIELLRNKNKIYSLDVCKLLNDYMIKNDNLINKINQYIKEKFINLDLQKEINFIFDFNNTSTYYKNYILINVINALKNKKEDKDYLILFINSHFWNDIIIYFIYKFSIKDVNNEKNEVLQTINNIIEIFKLLNPLNKENICDLIVDKILQFIYEIFYDSINKDINGDIFNSQSKTIEIILQFICSYKTIFIKLIQKILQNKTSKQLFLYILVNGIIESKNILIKKQIKMFIRRIYDDDLFKPENTELEISFSNFILIFLLSQKNLNLLSQISKNNNSISFNLYFEVCDIVIEKIYPLKINFNYNGYINTILIPQILSNETNEELLSGYFLMIYSMSRNYDVIYDNIKGNKFDFSNYIFYDLIFSKCKENPIYSKSLIIKNENTISNSLNLLTYLIINNEPKRLEILKKLYEFHNLEFWKSSQLLDWKKSFKDDKKSKFVGLKNLGSTCYMNSLLQILFLITSFRESILNTESIIEEKNVLFQLKYVFNSLKYNESQFFNPIEFTKNFDNEQLNIREQMDIDEFFNLLIEKLENHLQKTNNKNLIKYFFQGKNIDNLIFQEGCTHHRKNEISFYSIQLPVKNKNNLFQSLDYFIDGEVMSGDNAILCQTCNKKIPSIKYQSFNILPRILIFVLKRFEFNYNTMTKIKINDYYEFPIDLDMTNYTYDYLNNKNNYDRKKNNNLYKLKGFVVHSGTCENGHYYSFIYDHNYNQWFEFNDISVNEFNIENMKKEAFGGFEYFINNKTKKQEKKELNRNAYLLFYEKVDMSNCENYNDVEICNSISNYIKEDVILKRINNNLFQYNIEKIIFSVQYHRFILQFLTNILYLCFENDKFLIFLQYFTRTNDADIISKDLFNLRNKIIGSNLNNYINLGKIKLLNKKNKNNDQKDLNRINILTLFRFLITYFYNVLVRAEKKSYLSGTVDLIKFCLNQYNECSNYLIEEFCNTSTLMEYLINCPVLEMKKLFVGIIYCAMIKLYNDFNEEIKKNIGNNINLTKNNENNKDFYDINAMDDIEINDKPNAERIQTSSLKKFFTSITSNNNINKESSEIELKVSNYLQSNHIPKILLKFINNLIYFLQIVNDDKDCMFIYYILYRFSLISPYTKDYLITNIPFLTYLMYHLFPKYSKYNIPYTFTLNLNIDYIQSEHNDLCSNKNNNAISKDKSAYYRKETYIYMLCYNLLSGQRALTQIDKTYQFDNLEFILELFLGIRTKQDAFCFSHLVNKLCYNNSDITTIFSNAFMKIIENNESIDLDNIMIVYKRFLIDINDDIDFQESRIKSSLKQFFKLIFKYNKVYSHCDYCIQFTINIFFYNHLKMYKYVDYFKSYFEDMKEWIDKNPIPPLIYEIKGLQMYKKEQNYQNEKLDTDIKSFKEKNLRHSKRNKIFIDYIINSKNIIFFNIFYRKNNSS